MWLTLAPILTFWTAALGFHWLGWNASGNLDHPRNRITWPDTVNRMLQIDALHVLTTYPMELGWVLPADQLSGVRWWYLLGGIVLMDTLQYWIHRAQHEIPWLYRHVHYAHHAMRHSYSFGSFYNSFAEVFLVSPFLVLGFFHVFRFTFTEFQLVSSLSVLWTVMDHTAAFDHVWWLGRPNFHYVHHSVYMHCNFQQPFGTYWDRWMGTDYASVVRKTYEREHVPEPEEPLVAT